MLKKRIPLLLLPLLLLSACQINFSADSHDEGTSDGSELDDTKIVYYDGYGDTLVTEGCTSHTVTMHAEATEQGADITGETMSTDILALMNDPDSLFSSVTAANYVAQGIGGLKVGHVSTSLKGKLVISLSASITMVEIYAKPRSASIYGEEATTESIDTPVALSVNESKYVKLDTAFTAISEITETKCSYQLSEAASSFTLSVYGQRAIVTKVVLYEAAPASEA